MRRKEVSPLTKNSIDFFFWQVEHNLSAVGSLPPLIMACDRNHQYAKAGRDRERTNTASANVVAYMSEHVCWFNSIFTILSGVPTSMTALSFTSRAPRTEEVRVTTLQLEDGPGIAESLRQNLGISELYNSSVVCG